MISERMRQRRIDRVITMIDELSPAGAADEWLRPWLDDVKRVLRGECAPGECESDTRCKPGWCPHLSRYDTGPATSEARFVELVGNDSVGSSSSYTRDDGNVVHTFTIIERKKPDV